MGELNLNIIIYPFVAIVSIIGILLNKERSFFKLLAVILTILAMLRFDTGYDYYWYYAVSKAEFMNDIQIQKIYVDLEPGMKKIVDLARYLNHPQYFFAITGLITFGLIFYTIYRNSKSPLISLVFFMFLELGFVMSTSYVMQMTALSITFYSIKYLSNKKYFKYLFFILLSTIFFHTSSIICSIFIFFPRKKISKKYWIVYSLILLLTLSIILPKIILSLFPHYYYLLGQANLMNTKGKKDIIISVFFLILFFILDLKIKNKVYKRRDKNEFDLLIENIFIFGTILSTVLFVTIGGHFPFRVGIYFLIYILLVIPSYIDYLNLKFVKVTKIFLIVILNFWIVRVIFKNDYFYLNKQSFYEKDGFFNARPNSYGFKLFFKKNQKNMFQYLPGEEEHIRK